MKDILNDKIDFILSSIDGIAKASPKPFLLTRINACLNNPVDETVWGRIAFFLKKPIVFGFTILLLLFINILVIKSIKNRSEIENITKTATTQKYDFAINVSVLYDTENHEP